MKKSPMIETLQDTFESACMDLFSSLDCDVKLIPYQEVECIISQFDNDYTAYIDLGSDDIELISVLQMPLAVLAMTYPVENILTLTDETLEDWISELSNQLIGRLKNKLIKHDCILNLGLPETFYEKDIDDLLPEDSGRYTIYFDIDGQVCGCTLAIEVYNENLTFTIEENDMDLLAEGELELF